MDTIKSFNMAIMPTIPRPGIVISILFLLGVCFVVPAPGGTYYVSLSGNDSNPGTESQSWRTLQKAADTLVAGDVVHIRAGISLASEDGSLVRDIKIYNNVVYDNQSNGLEIGNWGEPGVTTRPIESITFINNTVYHNGFGT